MSRRTPRRAAALSAAGAAVVLGLLLSACSVPAQDDVETLPEITLSTLDAPGRQSGEDVGEVYLPDVKGPAVVNLWASWCGPCREELPVLEQFEREHGDDVRVLGVNYLETVPDKAADLVERSGLSYQLLSDPDGELDSSPPFPALRGLPFWAVVDEDGRVVHREFVEVTSVEQVEAMVEDNLGVRL